MPEPFDTLTRLAEDGGAPGLPPAEVRRRGDRLRRRRTALQAVVATAAIAVVVGAGATLTGGSDRRGDPAPATQPTRTGQAAPTIPAGIALAQGLPDPGGDGTVVGPSNSDKAALRPIEVCGTRAYPVERATDRLSVRYEGPEDFRGREVTAYDDPSVAKLVVDGMTRAMRDCPREDAGGTTAVTRTGQVAAGDESWAYVTTYEQQGQASVGLQVVTASRVGRYVVVTTRADEGGPADAQTRLGQQMGEVRSLLAGLAGDHVLTHDGYGSLRLGMTAQEVTATHEAVVRDGPGCAAISLSDLPAARDTADGFVSARLGLVAIFARRDVRTEEGIRIGGTRVQVQQAYGGGMDDSAFVSHVVGPRTSYVFGFDGDRVVSIALQREGQDCYQ